LPSGEERGRNGLRSARPGLCALIAIIVCGSASASAQAPAADDRQGWVYFCAGFYQEVSEQAIQEDNRLLHNKATEKRESIGDEISTLLDTEHSTPAEKISSWIAAGESAAGKGIWEAAPLIDRSMREKIAAMRSPTMSRCDEIAAQSYLCCHGALQRRNRAMDEFSDYLNEHPTCNLTECPPKERRYICKKWGGDLSFLNCRP
jgi:hypothetical protein